jgi:signal peptidase I
MEIVPPRNKPEVGPANQAAPDSVYPNADPSHTYGPPPPVIDRKPDKGPSRWRSAFSTLGLLISAFVIAILLNTFVIQSYQVDGQSMEPTLQNDDRLIVNKVSRTVARIDRHAYVPHRGDIIIFNQASLPGFVGTKQLIKRVIGLPGEHVVVKDGKITIYNDSHPNGYDPDTSGEYNFSTTTTVGNVDWVLQKDEIFVCGDNRNNSEDSRYFGPIKVDQVVAKLVLRILPLNKAQGF